MHIFNHFCPSTRWDWESFRGVCVTLVSLVCSLGCSKPPPKHSVVWGAVSPRLSILHWLCVRSSMIFLLVFFFCCIITASVTKLYVLALCVPTPRQRIRRLSGQGRMPFADHSDFLFLSCMAVLSLDSLLLLDFQCCTLKEMVGAGIPSLYQLVGKLCLWYSQPKHGRLLLIDIQLDHPLILSSQVQTRHTTVSRSIKIYD